jgi:dihydrolipoamide dehydrogenase
VIEQGALGGTCLNVGCIPSKAILHASEMAWNLRQGPELGIEAGAASINGPAFMERVKKVVEGLRQGVESLLKGAKIDVVRGRGHLTGPKALVVETDSGPVEIGAESIIVATGSVPARPGFLPWDSPRLWTTDEATRSDDLPDSVIVVGGGIIGSELATAYAELGIPTTVVEMLPRLASTVDEDVSKAITTLLKKRGARVLVDSKIVGVEAGEDGVKAELEGGEALEAAVALVAVGRKPNTEDVGLEDVGVELEDGLVKVDEGCRTSVDGVYAIGDCAERRQYAHLASRMGIVAADNATGHEAKDDRKVVSVGVYTHPEVGTVGLSESEAREACDSLRVSRFSYRASGMARAYGEPEGQVKLMADENLGEILGAVVIGQHATDVVQEIALAMRHELTVDELAETIHPHPTFVEGILEASEAWLGFGIHAAG